MATKRNAGPTAMLSSAVEIAIRVALNDAHRRRHEYSTVEHLTYALLHDDDTILVLKHCGADIDALKKDFDAWLDSEVEKVPDDEELETQASRGESRPSCGRRLALPRSAPASSMS